jgi:predicted nucleotidyltransferase component of viral defense system
MRESYREQVQLLVQILPFVADEECFALKGGTAINLFIRDLPRLSVDIDLTYLPLKARTDALAEIDEALKRIAQEITKALPGVSVQMSPRPNEKTVDKMQVQRGRTRVKVEITPVLRGCVFEPEWRTVTPSVEKQFGFAEIQVVSFADLYAGKIVAALDRQHPRDLFDVRDLLANEGIGPELREAFLIYLLSGSRPLAELLAPPRRDIRQEYERGFQGMATREVAIEALEAAREDLLGAMVSEMPDKHRAFLISVKEGEPRWDLLTVTGVDALPAVQWRLQNLAKMDAARRSALLEALHDALWRA